MGGMVTTIIVKPVLKGHLWDKEKVVLKWVESYEIVYDRTRKM